MKKTSKTQSAPDYEAAEREHLGDAGRGTGIYHPDNQPTPAASDAGGQADASAMFNGFDITNLPPILISCVAKLWPGSSGLFWEAALEKMPERIERLMARTAAASAPAAPAQLVVGTGVSGDGMMVTVHLKRSDHTTVVYLRNHALNGDTIGVSDLSADLLGADRAPATSAAGLSFEEWFEAWRRSTWRPLPSDIEAGRAECPKHWNTNARRHMQISWEAARATAKGTAGRGGEPC